MKRRQIKIEAEAQAEIEAAAIHYEINRPGLGKEFFDAASAAIESLGASPDRSTPVPREPRMRRVMVKRFPFAVVFTREPALLRVIAVMHLRREPFYWRHRR